MTLIKLLGLKIQPRKEQARKVDDSWFLLPANKFPHHNTNGTF